MANFLELEWLVKRVDAAEEVNAADCWKNWRNEEEEAELEYLDEWDQNAYAHHDQEE